MSRVLALAVLMFQGPGLGTATSAAPTARPVEVAFSRDTDFVDRLHTDSSESAALSLAIYDTLLYRAPDSGGMRGLLAESWIWNADRTAIDVTLRQGVRFHDDEEFDADDVVYTIGLALDPESGFRQRDASFGFIAGVEKIDVHHVRIILKYPSATAEDVFASRLVIWPATYTQTSGGHLIHRTAPVGTGPFRVASLKPNSEILLNANPDYFSGPKPAAQVPSLRVRFIPDAQTQIAELLSGALDFAWDLPIDQARMIAEDSRFTVSYGSGARIDFLSLDAAARSGPSALNDRNVRKAIALAIDRTAIAGALGGPAAEPLWLQCHPRQHNCPVTEQGQARRFDPAQSKRLLADAGYPNGLALDLMVGSPRLKTVAEALQWQLGRIGIAVRVRQYTLPAWRRKFMAGESRASLVAYGGDLLDVAHTLPLFFDAGANDYGRDSVVSAWLDEALRSPSPAATSMLFEKILRRIDEEVYTVPILTETVSFVHRRDLCYPKNALPIPDVTRLFPCPRS